MFLTPSDMLELTGYRRGADQRAWLERNRVPYFTARNGRPVILRSVVSPPIEEGIFCEVERSDHAPARLEDFIQSKDEIRRRRVRWTPGAGANGPGVYFLFFRYALVYVGKASDIGWRVRAHRMNYFSRKSRVIPFTEFSWVETPIEMNRVVELFYIHRDSPPLNIADNINLKKYRVLT